MRIAVGIVAVVYGVALSCLGGAYLFASVREEATLLENVLVAVASIFSLALIVVGGGLLAKRFSIVRFGRIVASVLAATIYLFCVLAVANQSQLTMFIPSEWTSFDLWVVVAIVATAISAGPVIVAWYCWRQSHNKDFNDPTTVRRTLHLRSPVLLLLVVVLLVARGWMIYQRRQSVDAIQQQWSGSVTSVGSEAKIELTGPNVDDDALRNLSSIPNVVSLSLAGSKISDDGLASLRRLRRLSELDLSETLIEGSGLQHLRGLRSLRSLSLANTKVDDSAIENLSGLTKLKELDLSGTRVSGPGLASLEGLSALVQISLKGTKVDDSGISHMPVLPNLGRLSLAETQVSGQSIEHVAKFQGLWWLSLANTSDMEPGLNTLTKLEKLADLQLDGTSIAVATIQSLQQRFSQLEISGSPSLASTDECIDVRMNLDISTEEGSVRVLGSSNLPAATRLYMAMYQLRSQRDSEPELVPMKRDAASGRIAVARAGGLGAPPAELESTPAETDDSLPELVYRNGSNAFVIADADVAEDGGFAFDRGPVENAKYRVEIGILPSEFQPASVREVIGDHAERLAGPLAILVRAPSAGTYSDALSVHVHVMADVTVSTDGSGAESDDPSGE